MNDFAKIVEQYRQADEERRLHLYLDCPPLREEFLEIDRQNAAARQNTWNFRPAITRRLIGRLLLKCC